MARKVARSKKKRPVAPAETTGESAPRPYSVQLCLGLVLLLSFGLRLYYLFQTHDQPVWWDEANYLVKAKSLALGTPESGFWAGRPILFPILLAPSFALGWGELGIRIIIALTSFFAIFLIYKIGARLVDPWAGVIAAALFSCHYLNLFYTQRVMCEIPYATMALLGVFIFVSAQGKFFWMAGPVLGCAVLMRYPAFVIPVSLLLFVLITERKKALTRKDYWITAALAALTVAPDAVLRGSRISHAVGSLEGHVTLTGTGSGFDRIVQFWNALKLFWSSMPPLVGTGLFLSLVLVGWYMLNHKTESPKMVHAHLLLLLLMAGPLIVHGVFIIHIEDRYLYFAIAPACLLVGSLIWHAIRFCPPEAQGAAIAVTSVALSYVVWASVSFSSATIQAKLTAYGQLKVAGEWIRQQKDAGPIMSQSVAQLTYYSEQPGFELPDSPEKFLELVKESGSRYTVISGFESHPEWTKSFEPGKLGMEVLMALPQEQPELYVLRRL